MAIHLRLELKEDVERMEDVVNLHSDDDIDTQVPQAMPPPIVFEMVENAILGRGEDEVLAQKLGDSDSDAEFNRQMALLRNLHINLAPFHAHHRGVSRKHARLSIRNTRLTVSDLGSTNGTYLNNERLQPNIEYGVKQGDEIRLGFLTLTLTII
ncbi:MAG: FHA domain-containing protein [Phototrophicaceae bacterium]